MHLDKEVDGTYMTLNAFQALFDWIFPTLLPFLLVLAAYRQARLSEFMVFIEYGSMEQHSYA